MDQQSLEETVRELGQRLAQSEETVKALKHSLAQLVQEFTEFRALRCLKVPDNYEIDIRGRLTVKAGAVVIESKSNLDLMSGTEIRQEAANIVATGNAQVQIRGGMVRIN